MSDGFMYDVFLSGPMTGVAGFNFKAFNDAAFTLRELGYSVFNPAEINGSRPYLPREWYFRQDVMMLTQCREICTLTGWQHSPGASLERQIAKECGIQNKSMSTLIRRAEERNALTK